MKFIFLFQIFNICPNDYMALKMFCKGEVLNCILTFLWQESESETCLSEGEAIMIPI